MRTLFTRVMFMGSPLPESLGGGYASAGLHRSQWDLVCVLGLIIVMLISSPKQLHAQDSSQTSQPHTLNPDSASAQVCPAGPTTTMFMVFVTCPQSQFAKLFPNGGLVRTVHNTPQQFTAFSARSTLSRLTAQSDSLFAVVNGGTSYANGPSPEARITPDGDGFAFLTRWEKSHARVAVCFLSNGEPVGKSVTASVRHRDLILVKLLLGDVPCVCVMYVTTPEFDASRKFTPRFERARTAFYKSLQESPPGPALMIRPREVSRSVEMVLQGATYPGQ